MLNMSPLEEVKEEIEKELEAIKAKENLTKEDIDKTIRLTQKLTLALTGKVFVEKGV